MNSIIVREIFSPVFDERRHAYTVNGMIVPSVTQLLRPLTSLVYGNIDQDVLTAAADFGTAVHACTEFLDQGDLDEETVADEWRPYLDAYKRWKASASPEILHIELRLGCSKFAGTIDRIARIDGQLWVIDLKTTCEIHPHVGVQLAAYTALAEQFLHTTNIRRAALQLRPDGTFRLKEFSSVADETCFNALLSINYWTKVTK